jgi:hypothetical protein
MILGDLTAADGPPCPRCGCRDVQIIAEPGEGWGACGRAVCNHCGYQFGFAAPQTTTTSETASTTPPEPPAGRRRRWGQRRART